MKAGKPQITVTQTGFDPARPLRVLRFRGGQDSTALLYPALFGDAFRERYPGSGASRANLLVVMAGTGDEYPDTYRHVAQIREFLLNRPGIFFAFVTAEMGFHGRTWQSLSGQMERNNNIMSVAMPKSCADNLKIKVVYHYIAAFLRTHYGFRSAGHRTFEYAHYSGKLPAWIGFARGEESRVADPVQTIQPGVSLPASSPDSASTSSSPPAFLQGFLTIEANLSLTPKKSQKKPREHRPRWMRRTIKQEFPLLDLGMDRRDCQDLIGSRRLLHGGPAVPPPPNCMMCPFQNEAEIVFLCRTQPGKWAAWVEREAALNKFARKPVSLGVKGRAYPA